MADSTADSSVQAEGGQQAQAAMADTPPAAKVSAPENVRSTEAIVFDVPGNLRFAAAEPAPTGDGTRAVAPDGARARGQAGGAPRAMGGVFQPAQALPMGLTRGRVRHSVQVSAVRGAASADMHQVCAVPGQDVVVIHINDGPSLMLSPENARLLMRAQQGALRPPAAAPVDPTAATPNAHAGDGAGPPTSQSASTAAPGADADAATADNATTQSARQKALDDDARRCGPASASAPHGANARSSVVDAGTRGGTDAADEAAPATRGAASVAVASALQWRGIEASAAPSRGLSDGLLGKVVISGFEVVTDLVEQGVADSLVDWVVRHFEQHIDEGVYRLSPDLLAPFRSEQRLHELPARSATPADGASDADPTLVLIHGTFSSTRGTFADLWNSAPQQVRELFRGYGDRVYALEHRTLSASPLDNALSLLRALPTGRRNRLHLLTHSRGGLVAEALVKLCSGADAAVDARHFGTKKLQHHRDALAALRQLVRERQVDVSRVVRVACPARGTLLASGRLDAYLSVLRWVMTLSGVPLLPQLADLLAEVARRRTDPDELPGLAAMVPDGAFIKWLHDGNRPAASELRVIAGDVQADSIGAWVKTLIADGLYWQDNDFVVQTSSMYGGVPRAEGASYFLEQSGAISHFGYFANERTLPALSDALLSLQPGTEFRAIGALSAAGLSSSGARGKAAPAAGGGAGRRPAVVVVPGMFGSHLKHGGQRVWLGGRLADALATLRYRDPESNNALDADGVAPDGLVGAIYDDLIERLEQSHDVIEFAYDWRLPIEDEALRLARLLDAELAKRSSGSEPLRLLAHSSGGLLCRAVQCVKPEVWKRLMDHPGARLLMLGTPNAGTWRVMQALSGDDSFAQLVGAFAAPGRQCDARQLLAGFPGLLQLQAGLLDSARGLAASATWQKLADDDRAALRAVNWWHEQPMQSDALAWGVPDDAVLARAQAFQKLLQDSSAGDGLSSSGQLLLVTGVDEFTADGYEMTPTGLKYIDAPTDGDGWTTLESARLRGVKTWRVDAPHMAMADFAPAFDAYVELLTYGDTQRLPLVELPGEGSPVPARGSDSAAAGALPAAAAGAAPGPAQARSTAPAFKGFTRARQRPSRAPLQRAQPPLGEETLRDDRQAELAGQSQRARRVLQVEVVNGDLSHVDAPLLLGHYRSMELTGTERVANRLLGDAMQQSLNLELYPDDTGCFQVFVNHAGGGDNPWVLPRPQAVVVVGLGEEGKLRGRDLAASVRQGVLAWSQRQHELDPAGQNLTLAATLVGSGGQGITVGQSAQMVVQGVRDANERLTLAGLPTVARLRLIELYAERAREAWAALRVNRAAQQATLQVAERLGKLPGALIRPLESSYRGAAYDYISALSARDERGHESIAYSVDTKRARVEVRAQSTQVALLRQLVAKAAVQAPADPRFGRTLFQLLVPIEMTAFIGGASEVVLELDRRTAPIPWEMVETPGEPRDSSSRVPWSVRAKLLRKLRTAEFRRQPRDAQVRAQVLVVGNPAIDDPRWPELDGARREAAEVQASLIGTGVLGRGDVRLIVDGSAHDIINTLFEREWRIVHIAGHGDAPQPGETDSRGVVLGNDVYIGACEIRAMRSVPELVFINCCHLGAFDARAIGADRARANPGPAADPDARRTLSDPAQFAASIAEELIQAGVRCVVACGWAVDDDAAQTFAGEFYKQLLDQARFIDAVAHARKSAWDRAAQSGRADNTWAAYQCYGDPEWRLRAGPGRAARDGAAGRFNEFDDISAPDSLCVALDTLAVRAQGSDCAIDHLRDQLRWLEARHAGAWGGLGAVAEAFGIAWEAADDRQRAMQWQQRAVMAQDGGASFRAQQSLCTLRVREELAKAQQVLAQDQPTGAAGAEAASARHKQLEVTAAQIQSDIQRLRALAEDRKTAELWQLCASAGKRLAMLYQSAGDAYSEKEQQSLAEMRRDYRNAATTVREVGEGNWFYPSMNALIAGLLIGDADAEGVAEQHPGQLLNAIHQDIKARHRDAPDFFSISAVSELQLLEALTTLHGSAERRDLQQELPGILRDLEDLHRRVAAPPRWRAVFEQVQWYAPRLAQRLAKAATGAIANPESATQAARAVAAVDQLLAALARWSSVAPADTAAPGRGGEGRAA